jgi:hypothetical protein
VPSGWFSAGEGAGSDPVEVAAPAPFVDVPADSVPLSVLALDLSEPVGGWRAFHAGRDIEVVVDDLGRKSVARADARLLLDEQRELEALKQAKREAAERQAIELDQRFRRQLWGGIPADRVPPGIAPAAVMLQAERDAQPKRTSVLQEALGGSDTLTFHSLAPAEGES